MSFDRKTNTISFRDEPELIVDTGVLFVTELRNDAFTPGVPKELVEDWKIVESWLSCTGRELTDDDCQKIGVAWRSYIARGVAPSVALEPVFKDLSKKAKEQSWKTEKVPPDLFRAVKGVTSCNMTRQMPMDRPLRIGFSGALYRVISKEFWLGLVIQYLSRNWGYEYGLFEVPDLALCHLVQPPGIESVGKCIPSWWGNDHWV